jgi:microsomal dipeptidase-like Zn-dependent dipeptidase
VEPGSDVLRVYHPHAGKADLQQLSGLLAGRGYGEADIAAILHGNWLRLLRQAWTGSTTIGTDQSGR